MVKLNCFRNLIVGLRMICKQNVCVILYTWIMYVNRIESSGTEYSPAILVGFAMISFVCLFAFSQMLSFNLTDSKYFLIHSKTMLQ
jgi:hypothetical protein